VSAWLGFKQWFEQIRDVRHRLTLSGHQTTIARRSLTGFFAVRLIIATSAVPS